MLCGGVTVAKCSLGVPQSVCISDIYGTKALDHYGSSILVTPHVSVNIVKMVY